MIEEPDMHTTTVNPHVPLETSPALPAKEPAQAAINLFFSNTNIIHREETLSKSSVQSPSNVALTNPEPITPTFDVDELRRKVSGDGGIQSFEILGLLHELYVQMRRQASEFKQNAYQSEWEALENKAEKMIKAASKDLAAGMFAGGMSLAGGAVGLYAGYKSMKQTAKAESLAKPAADIDAPNSKADAAATKSNVQGSGQEKTLETVRNDVEASASPTQPTTSQAPNRVNSSEPPATPQPRPNNTPDADNTLTPTQNSARRESAEMETTRRTDPENQPLANRNTATENVENGGNGGNQANAATTEALDASQQNALMSQIISNKAFTYTNLGQAVGQIFEALGGVGSSGFRYAADMDRAAKERDEAEATKAQADVDSEAEFVRTASEGLKSIQDFLDQFITSRNRTNLAIMA